MLAGSTIASCDDDGPRCPFVLLGRVSYVSTELAGWAQKKKVSPQTDVDMIVCLCARVRGERRSRGRLVGYAIRTNPRSCVSLPSP